MKLYIATPINARQEPTMREKFVSLELPSESRLGEAKAATKREKVVEAKEAEEADKSKKSVK